MAANTLTLTGANDTLFLDGFSFLFNSGTLSNTGTIQAQGDETITFTSTSNDTDSGTWEYVGDGGGTSDTRVIEDFGATDYYNLTINDPNGTPANRDVFTLGANISYCK